MKQKEDKKVSVQVEQDNSKAGEIDHVKSEDILEKVREVLQRD